MERWHERGTTASREEPTKSETSTASFGQIEFGKAGALYQDMMPQTITTVEHSTGPHCTREQARELLEALRAAYQSLPFAQRSLVKNLIGQVQRAEATLEIG